MLAVLVSVRFWRLFCTDCCPLGARWPLFVVRSREVSATRYSEVLNVATITIGRAIGGMEFVHCTEVVRLSESPLLEVSLYSNTETVYSIT